PIDAREGEGFFAVDHGNQVVSALSHVGGVETVATEHEVVQSADARLYMSCAIELRPFNAIDDDDLAAAFAREHRIVSAVGAHHVHALLLGRTEQRLLDARCRDRSGGSRARGWA